MPMLEGAADEGLDLDRLVDDLSTEHPELHRERIAMLVHKSAEQFQHAAVKDFIPVLVRRDVAAQL